MLPSFPRWFQLDLFLRVELGRGTPMEIKNAFDRFKYCLDLKYHFRPSQYMSRRPRQDTDVRLVRGFHAV